MSEFDQIVDIYATGGHVDTARAISYMQCTDSIKFCEKQIAKGEDLDEAHEQMAWWEDRLQFFRTVDDTFHIERHYPGLYFRNGNWYEPYDPYENY